MDREASSRKQLCPYCGQGALELAEDSKLDLPCSEQEKAAINTVNTMLQEAGMDPLSLADEEEGELGRTYLCSNCGSLISASQLEEMKDAGGSALSSSSAIDREAAASAAEILDSAWQLMQKSYWEKAAAVLAPPYPPFHALECAVYLSVCQMAPEFLQEYAMYTRCEQLYMLSENLKKIDKFLPKEPHGHPKCDVYTILQRVHQALMLLGTLTLHCATNYDIKSRIIDRTNCKRCEVLVVFAEYLESRGADARHGTGYLKMAAELYHKCLEAARERYCHIILSREINKLQIPPQMRRHIKAKIAELNKAISERDAKFTPRQPLPDPKIMPTWLLYLLSYSPAILLCFPLFVDDKLLNTVLRTTLSANSFGHNLEYYIMNGYLPAMLAVFAFAASAVLYKLYYNK